MNYLWGALIFALAVFLVPAPVARFLVGGDWRQVAISYILWFALLMAVLGIPGGGTWTEKLNWMALAAVILSVVAVPVLTLIQRIAGWALTRTA